MATIGKEEAARILGMSERTLERNAEKYQREYGLKITYEQGRTKRVPTYDRAQIVALSERLKSPVLTGQMLPPDAGAREIATQSDNGDAAGALVAIPEAGRLLAEMIADAVRDALRPAPAPDTLADINLKLTLSVAEASRLCGLSPGALRAAINAGELAAKIIPGRRGWTIKRADLDRYVKGL